MFVLQAMAASGDLHRDSDFRMVVRLWRSVLPGNSNFAAGFRRRQASAFVEDVLYFSSAVGSKFSSVLFLFYFDGTFFDNVLDLWSARCLCAFLFYGAPRKPKALCQRALLQCRARPPLAVFLLFPLCGAWLPREVGNHAILGV